MPAPDLTPWYLAFAIGAMCVFAVVVAVVRMLQLSHLISGGLADVRDTLRNIREATTAIPGIHEINRDVRELITTLADTREQMSPLLEEAAP